MFANNAVEIVPVATPATISSGPTNTGPLSSTRAFIVAPALTVRS